MMVAIRCPGCKHIGAVQVTRLPAILTCFRCGARATHKYGAQVRSRTTAMLDREVLHNAPDHAAETKPVERA